MGRGKTTSSPASTGKPAVRKRSSARDRSLVTRQKELERHAEIHGAILRLFLEVSSQKEYFDRVTKLLRQSTGCHCLGIRALGEDGSIPFVAYEGFTPEFMATESQLSLETDQCACIRVIGARLEPQDTPAITPTGSFCRNDLSGFFGSLPAEERARFRGVCLNAGFKTMAVVPIRYGDRPIGAIHLADERLGALPLPKLRVVESVAPLIGEAVYRFRVEQELRRSEATLAEAQRIAHVGNWDWNISTGELAWSDEVYRMFGLVPQPSRATYQAFLEYVHPDDREFVEKSVDEALHGGKPYDIDHRIVLPDGSARVVHENGVITFDESGKPARMLGTVHDITEHKTAEEQLRALSRRLVEVQEDERRIIARDLHDRVGQTLMLVSLSIERAARSPAEKTQSILEETRALVKEIIGQVREMSLALRPSILDDLGLLPAFLWHFEHFTVRTNIKVSFEHSDLDIEFPWDIRTAAYRIMQEALNNVARYAGVTEVLVCASVHDNVLSMEIEDHGAGFDPEQVTLTSTGIHGMEERAHLLGGSLTLDSAPGAGTHIAVELPLPGGKGERGDSISRSSD